MKVPIRAKLGAKSKTKSYTIRFSHKKMSLRLWRRNEYQSSVRQILIEIIDLMFFDNQYVIHNELFFAPLKNRPKRDF
jgi:hypothetical protein